MDFGALLHVAKKNSENTKSAEGKYYSTKFSAPKKESKEKKLSDNIKRFLEKRDHEEREKLRAEKEKRDALLAMRDEKAKNKIKKMLKMTKSANKSVLEDAVDTENTAVTIHGPDQPDEDDYGYVSNEAASFYQKYMDKVKKLPEENKFAPSRPQSRFDLSGTKDRVRAAIMKEQEEQNSSSRTKSSKTSTSTSSSAVFKEPAVPNHRRKDFYDPQAEREAEEKRRAEEQQQKAKAKKPAPPPMDFQQLLKLAEKKQYEPVQVVVDQKKEPERLLTKKEKREEQERRAYLEDRERRKRESLTGKVTKPSEVNNPSNSQSEIRKPVQAKDPKSTQSAVGSKDNNRRLPVNTPSSSTISKPSSSDVRGVPSKLPQHSTAQQIPQRSKDANSATPKPIAKPSHPSSSGSSSGGGNSSKKTPIGGSGDSSHDKRAAGSALQNAKPQQKSSLSGSATAAKPTSNGFSQCKDNRRPQLNKDVQQKTRQFPPEDRPRQFPPADVRRSKPMKKPQKRRILDDDSEYDSEMDDFIDDGPEEGQNYSSFIKEIFGYDKSRYRDYDDDDDDAMESNFAQISKEEYFSKKIGLMEDLEDMRIEAEEKKQKAIMKKRKLK